MEKQGHVYTLLLEQGFYYVGYSQDIQTRFASHWLGAGSKWTQIHKPVAVISVMPGDTHLQTLQTIALMCDKGWEKVRGGSYCTVEMTKPPACISKAIHYASYKNKEDGDKRVQEPES